MALEAIITDESVMDIFKNSKVMTLVLVNGDTLISYVSEIENSVILIYPVVVSYFYDDENNLSYIFKTINPITDDEITKLDKSKIIFANNVNSTYKDRYNRYVLKMQSILEEELFSNEKDTVMKSHPTLQ